MEYTIYYFFEENADRVDGFLIEDVAREYEDCRVTKLESDIKIDTKTFGEYDYITSFCEIVLECDTIQSFELIQDQIEKRYGLIPYKFGYGKQT